MLKEEYEDFVEKFEEMKENAEKALQWYNDNIKEVDGLKFLEVTDFDDDQIGFEGEEFWNYGGHEEYAYSIDARYLYDEEFKLHKVREVEIKKAENWAAAREAEQAAAKKKQEEERAEYERLKKKFE